MELVRRTLNQSLPSQGRNCHCFQCVLHQSSSLGTPLELTFCCWPCTYSEQNSLVFRGDFLNALCFNLEKAAVYDFQHAAGYHTAHRACSTPRANLHHATHDHAFRCHASACTCAGSLGRATQRHIDLFWSACWPCFASHSQEERVTQRQQVPEMVL